MTDTKKSFVQDLLGSLLFVVGAFLAFSIAMFWSGDGAVENPNFTTSIVLAAIEITGSVMGFVTGLACALLGGALFFSTTRVSILRHGGGTIGVLLGLLFLYGAFSPAGAGSIGSAPGTLLGGSTLALITSAVVGLFLVAATVWGVWVPRKSQFSSKLGESSPVSTALREGDEGGVTSAEAAALLPVDDNEEPIVPAHPIDVRLEGGIPEGAVAIQSGAPTETIHEAETSHTDDAPSGFDAGVEAVQLESADGHLAQAESADIHTFPEVEFQSTSEVSAEPEPAADTITLVARHELDRPTWEANLVIDEGEEPSSSAIEAAENFVEVAGVEEDEVTEVTEAIEVAVQPTIAPEDFVVTSVPEFDWGAEQEESVETAGEAEEVDEAEEADEVEEADEADEEEAEDSEELDELEEESEEEAEEEDEEIGEDADEESEEEEEEEWEDEEYEEEELDEEDPEAEYEDWEEEEGEEDGEEDGEEVDEEEDEEYEEEDESEEDDDEVEDEEEDEVDDDEEEEEKEEEEDEDDDEDEHAEIDAEEGEAAEEDSAEEGAEPELVIVAAESEPEPEPEPEATEPAAAVEKAAEEAEEECSEPDFVVEPPAPKAKRPSRRARRDAKSKGEVPSGGAEREALLHKAGMMIIERERVAVSLFQREFDLPFQKATEILDELQERGLIGPYLGGRHRDILLTREQWESKTPSS